MNMIKYQCKVTGLEIDMINMTRTKDNHPVHHDIYREVCMELRKGLVTLEEVQITHEKIKKQKAERKRSETQEMRKEKNYQKFANIR